MEYRTFIISSNLSSASKCLNSNSVKLKGALVQVTKTQRGSRGIALLFL